MSESSQRLISKKLSGKFRDFITNHPPTRISRHFRAVLLGYIREQSRQDLPIDFDLQIWLWEDFFDLLDCAVDEWENDKEP